MKAAFEKLAIPPGKSFRCFDRRINRLAARWHRHPEIELTFVPKGDGSRLVGDHIGAFTDDDLVLLGSNLPHNWAADEYRGQKIDMHEAIVTQFAPDFLGSTFFDVPEMQPIADLLQRSLRGLWYPPDFSRPFSQRLRELETMTGPSRLVRLLDCLTELSQFSGAVELASVGYCGPTTGATEHRMQVVFDYLQQNFAQPSLSASTLAALLEMNASAFSRFFKGCTGLTPSAYINELRVGYACRRLVDSDSSILDICYDSGFASVSNFNETFRKRCGMSPRQYTRQHRELHHSDNNDNK